MKITYGGDAPAKWRRTINERKSYWVVEIMTEGETEEQIDTIIQQTLTRLRLTHVA